MNKEWLEFLGGLLAFLAALVQLVRESRRRSKRKVSIRAWLSFFLPITTLAAFFLGVTGVYLDWNPFLETWLFLAYLLGQAAVFATNKTPLRRNNIGWFVFNMSICVLFLAQQSQRREFYRRDMEELARSLIPVINALSATPTPSPGRNPSPSTTPSPN